LNFPLSVGGSLYDGGLECCDCLVGDWAEHGLEASLVRPEKILVLACVAHIVELNMNDHVVAVVSQRKCKVQVGEFRGVVDTVGWDALTVISILVGIWARLLSKCRSQQQCK
jgi:hypothetical protein